MAERIHATPRIENFPPPLESSYTIEIDQVDEESWNNVLLNFDDANLVQTWPYGCHRWGRNNLSHFVLRKDGEIAGAAQLVLKTIPFLKAGIAYVKSGPLWQPRGEERNPENLRQIVRELRRIYVDQRGLVLRISPWDTQDSAPFAPPLFAEEGLEGLNIHRRQTALINLSYSLRDLRHSLRPTWRRNLVLAERNDMRIVHGTSGDLFAAFAELYRDMLHRKQRVSNISIDHFSAIQRDLPEALKMQVWLCELKGEPVAGLVVTAIGEKALNLLSATSEKGLKLRAAYFLQWRLLPWLMARNCRYYDLDLIDQQRYPGMTQFKLGFAGKLGMTSAYLGTFESSGRSVSRISVRLGSRLRTAYMRVKRQF